MNLFLVFFIMVLGGVIIEDISCKLYYKITGSKFKTHHYSLGKYLFLLFLPIVSVLLMVQKTHMPLIQVFLYFAVFGTFLEWMIGFFYHEIVGGRLWTYHKYDINKYTSILSVPIWGLAGSLFWVLIKSFG